MASKLKANGRDGINIFSGILIGMSLYFLYTDYLGLERYIESLNKPGGWIEPKISIPINIFIIFASLLMSYQVCSVEVEDHKEEVTADEPKTEFN